MIHLKATLSVLSALLISAAAQAGILIPTNFPEYQFIYDYARRAEFTDFELRHSNTVQPITSEALTFPYPFRNHFAATGVSAVRLFGSLAEETFLARLNRARIYESFRGGISGSPMSNLTIHGEFRIDEKLAKSPEYFGKKWRGFAGEVNTTYINYAKDRWDITLGRFVSNWGPVNQSLVLSSTARPMDAFLGRVRWGRFRFSFQTGQLNRLERILSDSTVQTENRFFAGHRLDIKLHRNLHLGLFETIIFGGYGRSFDLAYLNPLLFFHSVQLNNNSDDNTFLGCDISFYLHDRHKFYGQLLIDDFQIDKKEPGDYEPDEIGYMLGFESLNLFEGVDIGLQYCRIANRTYNQIFERNRYLHDGELLGYPLGPDGDQLLLRLTHWFNYNKKGGLELEYRRQGTGNVADPWTQPWLDSPGEYSEPFPTGTVEKFFRIGIGATLLFRERLFLNFDGGLRMYKNLYHQADNSQTIPYFSGKLSLLFSVPVNIE